ncbi:MAG: hypothetical protein JXB15_17215 [Anaerolineales bacterium]|nr:hypothetical protein [Anaerolineales bacterium]
MSENKNRKIIYPGKGVLGDLSQRIKLILRLIGDPRVSPLLKLIPIGSLAYFLIPDLAPGPIDDVAVMWLATYLFVEVCPPDVVQEHMDSLKSVLPGEWGDSDTTPDDIIDAEAWEREDESDSNPNPPGA